LKNGTVIPNLIKSCVLNKSVDPYDLLTGDRNALLISIRISGYGPEYPVRLKCPSCGEEYDHTFNLSSLPIRRLGAEPLESNVNAFSFTLPVSKNIVVFKLLTGRDEQDMSNAETLAKKKLGTSQEKNVTGRLFYSILSIGDITDKQKLSYMIQNLAARDSRALRTYMDKIEPDVEMKQETKCIHCEEENVVDVPLTKGFLWPEE